MRDSKISSRIMILKTLAETSCGLLIIGLSFLSELENRDLDHKSLILFLNSGSRVLRNSETILLCILRHRPINGLPGTTINTMKNALLSGKLLLHSMSNHTGLLTSLGITLQNGPSLFLDPSSAITYQLEFIQLMAQMPVNI